jgi:hypothetical protein
LLLHFLWLRVKVFFTHIGRVGFFCEILLTEK